MVAKPVKRETVERCEKDYTDATLLRMALSMLLMTERVGPSFLENNLTLEVIKERVAKNSQKGVGR